MCRSAFATLFLFGSLLVVVPQVSADTRLPSIIADHMVMQRGQELPIWGWDDPGTAVQVTIGKTVKEARAGTDGRWQVQLPAMAAGGPHELSVKGSSTILVKDILVGEVWLCSGQSNMEWTVKASTQFKEVEAAANHPRIRHIKIPHRPSDKPESDVKSGGWTICSPKTVGNFTGVGYFFGLELQKELKVPIGLIGSNWGGTRIEPWTPPVGFAKVPELESISVELDNLPKKHKDGRVIHQSPLALYNGMISPLVPFGIQGAIWYQGESNNGEGMLYFHKMKALILGWRNIWKRDEMPFLYVQLAPFRYGGDPTRLAEIWEAQTAALSIPHTGMAVTVDIGNVRDIHPRNKLEVGRRLALWALNKTYGKSDLVYSGPLYKSMRVEGSKIRLSFDHGEGLKSRDGKALSWFTIAGEDGKFVEAKATIEGSTILIESGAIIAPKNVRFGWDQTAEPNLSNGAGLPASPFRTDRPSK